MVMNYNHQSEDFNTLDRPVASEDNTVRFEDGSTMDIHEDSTLMESEIYTHVSHAMDDKVIARILGCSPCLIIGSNSLFG